MSEYNLFNRWPIKHKTFWWIVGGGFGGIIILVLIASMFLSVPMMGVASYDDNDYDTGSDNSFTSYDMAESSEMEKSASNGFVVSTQAVSPQAYDGEIVDTAFSERMIIREGNITIPVESTHNSRDAIKALVASFADKGAYIVSSNEYSYNDNSDPNINIVIRIPVDQFEFVMDELIDLAVGNVTVNTWSDDVSEEFNDLENRLESLEAARLRLLDIMANADTTQDLLAAEQQLTYRESEIESIKGRMQYLSESSSLSRVSIYLEPYVLSQPIDTSWVPMETIRYAIERLIDGLQNFADFLIFFLIATLPWLIVFGFIIWLVIRRVRKNRLKKSE